MATYYHVADKGYQSGQALYSFDAQLDMGWEPKWKWPEADAGFDGDGVCLFDNLDDAQEFMAEFVPDGKLLKIEVDPDDDRLRRIVTEEGYTAIQSEIPAELITVL